MDVKEAIQSAKHFVDDLFASESITHLGLEEVVFDEESNHWKITVGFFRPWDRKEDSVNPFFERTHEEYRRRTFKTVWIDDANGRPVSLTDRQPGSAA